LPEQPRLQHARFSRLRVSSSISLILGAPIKREGS
jgi:hypothetical protein